MFPTCCYPKGMANADPLSGILFSLRLQANAGGTTPVGLFQDTAATTPAVSGGDTIGAWKDMLGTSGLKAEQGTGAAQPTLQFDTTKPVVRFDGSDFLTTSTPLDQTGDFSLFALVNHTTTGVIQEIINNGNGSTVAGSQFELLFDSADTLKFTTFIGAGTITTATAAAPSTSGVWYVVSCTRISGVLTLYIDGASSGTADDGGAALNTGIAATGIGAVGTGILFFLNGDLAALMVTARTDVRTTVEAYLNTLKP